MTYVLEIPSMLEWSTSFVTYEYFTDYNEALTRIKVLKLQRKVGAKIVGCTGRTS